MKIKGTVSMVFALILGGASATAHADNVTFDVSGSMNQDGVDYLGNGLIPCLGAGCLLGGTLVINTATGALVSTDITISGTTPVIGPFTQVPVEPTNISGVEELVLASGAAVFFLDFSTPGASSLIGYAGGPFEAQIDEGFDGWSLNYGELKPEGAATPEPSSWLLFGSGLFSMLALAAYKRRGTTLGSWSA